MFNMLFRERNHFGDIEKNRVIGIISSRNLSANNQAVHRCRTNLKLIVHYKVSYISYYANNPVTGIGISYGRKADFRCSSAVNNHIVSVKRDYGFVFELLDA